MKSFIKTHESLKKEVKDMNYLENDLVYLIVNIVPSERDEICRLVQYKKFRNISRQCHLVCLARAGAGGAEAAKFAAELFRMYEMYARRRNWRFDTMSYTEEEKGGGVREAMAEISGGNVKVDNYPEDEDDELANGGVYKNLKFESGVHRVQRVPATETQGRIHTSTASVAIIPKAGENDIHIDETEDVKIETMRASGAGGQHVNTTNSAVRIVHIPTGITVVIQDERSQHKNKAKALSVLRSRVYDVERRKVAAKNAQIRRSLIGSADRSERIRTYNFKDGRCKDHRGSGVVVNDVQKLLDGFGLDEFIRDLHKFDLEEQMSKS